jgi:NSS family neurotransmitter:Na+ symporter
MKKLPASNQGMWRRQITFLMVSTGAAVGLGNIWKFPYIVGENGGGAFILMYFLCVLIVGVPIYIAETAIGYEARRNPIAAMRLVAKQSARSDRWSILGAIGCFAGLLILSYYAVVAGWGMHYLQMAVGGEFNTVNSHEVGALFIDLLSSPEQLLRLQTIFLLIVGFVVSLGVRAGLGVAGHLIIPSMTLMLGLLIAYSVQMGNLASGIDFMFSFNSEALTWASFWVALGHAFFSLSIGMGAVMAYGAYMPKRCSIPKMVFSIASLDVVFALLAGLAIFPIVFANDLEPSQGPGLMFVSLPLAFGNMLYGHWIGALFFGLVVLASLGSAVALLEPSVAWINERFGLPRIVAVILLIAIVWFISVFSMLSFNIWQDFRPINGLSLFELFDFVSANLLLPLGGLGLAIFSGWKMDMQKFEQRRFFRLWIWALRYITTPAVLIIFVTAIIQRFNQV